MRRAFLFSTLITLIGSISLLQRGGERIVRVRKFHSQLRENGDGDVHCRPVWMVGLNEGEDVADVMRMRNGEVKCHVGWRWCAPAPVAGDKVFVDYSGKRLGIADPLTGEIRLAEIFVAVLGRQTTGFPQTFV